MHESGGCLRRNSCGRFGRIECKYEARKRIRRFAVANGSILGLCDPQKLHPPAVFVGKQRKSNGSSNRGETETQRYYETVLSLLLISRLITDLCRLFGLALKSRAALAAENLFLRKQLSLYEERKARRSNTSIAVRWTMAGLGKLFTWRDALVIVKPDTFVRWHREAFGLFWPMEISPFGSPGTAKEHQNTDSTDGSGEPDLG